MMRDTALKTYPPKRLIPVLAGIMIQLCLGTVYIWGIFQVELISLFGWSQATAALPFSLLIFFMSVGCYLGGRFQDKYNPRPVIRIGGLILGLGFMLAALTTAATPWWIWLTYGVIGGLGMGTIYTTTIACCQKWFPDKRGLITGCIVSALGFGGIIFTNVAAPLIRRRGVLETFFWLGVIFILVCLAGARFIKNPPQDFQPAGWSARQQSRPVSQDMNPGQMIRTPQFYLIACTLMLACSAGFMVIPYAKTIGIAGGLSPAAATSGVMIISLFNSCGRLFWGWTSDRLGRKRTVLVLLLLASATIPVLMVARSWGILVIIALVAFAYGGFLGVFPSLTADFFGMAHAAANYGLVLFGFGFGSILFTYIAGFYRDTGRFGTAFILAAIASLTGAVLFWFLRLPHRPARSAIRAEIAGEQPDH